LVQDKRTSMVLRYAATLGPLQKTIPVVAENPELAGRFRDWFRERWW
jgi:hypothetical protein